MTISINPLLTLRFKQDLSFTLLSRTTYWMFLSNWERWAVHTLLHTRKKKIHKGNMTCLHLPLFEFLWLEFVKCLDSFKHLNDFILSSRQKARLSSCLIRRSCCIFSPRCGYYSCTLAQRCWGPHMGSADKSEGVTGWLTGDENTYFCHTSCSFLLPSNLCRSLRSFNLLRPRGGTTHTADLTVALINQFVVFQPQWHFQIKINISTFYRTVSPLIRRKLN